MNKFAFDLIDAINRDGLGNESWGVVENVADTVNYDRDIRLYNLD